MTGTPKGWTGWTAVDVPSRESASKPGQTLSESTFFLSIYPLESELARTNNVHPRPPVQPLHDEGWGS